MTDKRKTEKEGGREGEREERERERGVKSYSPDNLIEPSPTFCKPHKTAHNMQYLCTLPSDRKVWIEQQQQQDYSLGSQMMERHSQTVRV